MYMSNVGGLYPAPVLFHPTSLIPDLKVCMEDLVDLEMTPRTWISGRLGGRMPWIPYQRRHSNMERSSDSEVWMRGPKRGGLAVA